MLTCGLPGRPFPNLRGSQPPSPPPHPQVFHSALCSPDSWADSQGSADIGRETAETKTNTTEPFGAHPACLMLSASKGKNTPQETEGRKSAKKSFQGDFPELKASASCGRGSPWDASRHTQAPHCETGEPLGQADDATRPQRWKSKSHTELRRWARHRLLNSHPEGKRPGQALYVQDGNPSQ